MPVIFFDGFALLGLAGLAALVLLWGVVAAVRRAAKVVRGECIRHTPGRLTNVASAGGRAEYECTKCGARFWTP